MKKTPIIFITCLLFLLPLEATESKQYAFQQIINTQNGLSSSVRCLTVSHEKGYVWIGTRSGIGRFDGYELKKFLHDNITHIFEDNENKVWATTPKGLYYYNDSEDNFLQAEDKNRNPVTASSICSYADGVLFGSYGKIYKYDYADRQIKLLCSIYPDRQYNITGLQKWDKHTLLATNRWKKALLIDIRTGQTRPAPFKSDELVDCFIDSKGNIWTAPYHQGINCYDRNGKLLHAYHTQNSSMKTNVVLSITERNGHIWIATDGHGIYILNPTNGEITTLEHIPGNRYSLPVNSILCLYKDFNDNIWAGSVRGGLISIKEVGMKTYSDALPGIEYGLSEKVILSIYQDKENKIWIGTDGGGINNFDPALRKFNHILPTWGEKVSSITVVDKKRLLVSLFSKGIFFFDKDTKKYQPLIIVNDSINALLCQRGKNVNVFQNTPETVLLLSEYPYSYHLRKKQFTPIIPKGKIQIDGILQPVCNDGSRSFLHDSKHIYKLDSLNHLTAVYTCYGDTIFNSISLDENNLFWIGGNYGLSNYSLTSKKRTSIPNELIKEINALICDKRGKVWVGAEGKLFAHLIKEGEFILYGESDGIGLNEYLEKPRLLSMQGDVYMGGVNGLLCIDKQLPQEANTPPVLNLADVWVGGERMNKHITDNQNLKVIEPNKPISIKIVASNKDIFRKPMFRFTVEGLDGQVSYSYQPELTLNSLPIGTYQILASCSTRSGSWTNDYRVLKLTILPPWYKSGWFTACYTILILSIIIGIIYSLLRRNANKLKWAMKEHEQQVYEEKVRFLININHELRTPLTLIHAPLKQLLESLPPNDSKYSTIQSICKQSGRMKKLLNMVLDVRKMEVGQSTLNAEEVQLDTWIEQLVADFKPEAGEKGIMIQYQPDEKTDKLCFDKEKCTTILTNLLINALKYSPDNSQITVSVNSSNEKGYVRISVSDQGSGLKEVDINSLFTRFYQGNNSRPGTGIGLSYSKILAEQHRGSIGAYDHENAAGATFWFELPRDIQPGKITLQPQPYLNELLAPTQEIESPPSETTSQADTQERTILIVDDNVDLTDYLHSALKSKFKEVWIAPNGEEALRICRKSHPDIVVSDIQMPRMNGYELCKQIKEDFDISHIPVILLTARNDEESQLFGYKNGADAYLTKPFEVSMLYTMIRSQLKNRERMRTRYTEAGSLPQPEESTFSSADEDFLHRLNKLISDNLDNDQMGVPFLCSELGVSRASLYNKLKALTDMGANDYITKLRMERAIWLLMHSKLNINEISDQTGFSTPRYFSTVFKQYTGCSPTQYKEEHV